MTWRPTPGEAARLLELGRSDAAFERIIAGLAAQLLLPGEGAVDGGANRGLHTGLLRRLAGPRGWVLAVEPQPLLARALRTLQLPSAQHAPCTVVEAALAERDGRAPFHLVLNHPSYSGLRLRDTPTPPEVERKEREAAMKELLREMRASNTEPIVRAIAEAPTLDEARQLCDLAAHAEATGWDGLWVADHFMPNDDGALDQPMHEGVGDEDGACGGVYDAVEREKGLGKAGV